MLASHVGRGRFGPRATNRAFSSKPDTKNFRCRKRGLARGLWTIPRPSLEVSPATVSAILGKLFLSSPQPLLQPFPYPKLPPAPTLLPSRLSSAVAVVQLSRAPL